MKRIRLAQEVIDFQRDDTGSQIEAILYKMIEKIKIDNQYRLEGSPEDTELTSYVRDRFGLKIKFKYDFFDPEVRIGDITGIVISVRIAPHHILDKNEPLILPKDLRDFEYFKTAPLVNQKGTVDLKKAKVSGIFSKIGISCYMPIYGFHNLAKVTVPEITAVLLHEIGHPFTFFEFSSRLTSTNQILQNLADTLKTNNKKELQYIFKEITTKYDIDQDTFDDLIDQDNRIIFGFNFFRRYVGAIFSQLPNGKYDETASEQLADNFAARFGYGRELTTCYDKFSMSDPEKSSMSRAVFSMLTIINLVANLVIPMMAIMVAPAIFPILFSMIFVSFRLIYAAGDSNRQMTYDDLKIRYKRIRQQYIEALKIANMPKDELIKTINDIKVIDNIISKTALYRSIYAHMSNWMFTINRNTKRDIEFQQLLEELAHNDLFLKSAELSTL